MEWNAIEILKHLKYDLVSFNTLHSTLSAPSPYLTMFSIFIWFEYSVLQKFSLHISAFLIPPDGKKNNKVLRLVIKWMDVQVNKKER